MAEQQQRLLRMIDHSIRQTWLILFNERDAVFPGDILW